MSIVPNWQNVGISSTVNLTGYSINYPVKKNKKDKSCTISNLEPKVKLSKISKE